MSQDSCICFSLSSTHVTFNNILRVISDKVVHFPSYSTVYTYRKDCLLLKKCNTWFCLTFFPHINQHYKTLVFTLISNQHWELRELFCIQNYIFYTLQGIAKSFDCNSSHRSCNVITFFHNHCPQFHFWDMTSERRQRYHVNIKTDFYWLLINWFLLFSLFSHAVLQLTEVSRLINYSNDLI